MEERKFFRITTFVVISVLFILAWCGGCGGVVVRGGASINGIVVDNVTKNPIPGALVVLEQVDASGTDRIITSTVTASNGSFGFNPTTSGIFDVVADATVTSASGTTVTYAATVTFGVPANTSLAQIPLVPEFGNATPSGNPIALSATVISSGSIGVPSAVDVQVSALQTLTPAIGSVNLLTIPPFAGSITSITTMPNLSCASGTACANYLLLIPAGNPSVGTFGAGGTQYSLSVQQPATVTYTVEAKAFFHGTALTQDCTPANKSSQITIVNGALASTIPDLSLTGCL